jgi:hypothetical protein
MAVSVHSFQAGYAELLVHAISKTVPHTINSTGSKTTLGISLGVVYFYARKSERR